MLGKRIYRGNTGGMIVGYVCHLATRGSHPYRLTPTLSYPSQCLQSLGGVSQAVTSGFFLIIRSDPDS